MPFTGPDDPTLPERIKDMPEDVRDKWAKTWNAAFGRCENESGEDCEGVAFRIANSAIRENTDTMSETIQDIQDTLYAELAALVDGKPFDGFTHTHDGEFTDMHGRVIKIKKSELSKYVKNTKAAILAASTESGEVVGLPIDALNHNRGDAAGFIVDVELAEDKNVIRFTPKWTELGLEKIRKGLQRFFSPTFNTERKVVMGGSLSNWIGSLNPKNGNVLLRPIELSQGFYVAEAAKPETLEVPSDAKTTTVTGTVDGHEVTVTSEGTLLPPKNLSNLSIESQAKENDESGDTEMGMSKDELAEFIRAEVGTSIGAAVKLAMPKLDGEAIAEGKPVFNILDALDLSEVGDDAAKEFKEAFLLQAEQIRETAKREAMQTISLMRREQDVVEFAQRITGGTDDHPVGIPSTEDEIKNFLMGLKPEQAKKAIEILSAIQETGLTEFVEKGHSKRLSGTAKLESPISKQLSKWLEDGGKISEFFKMNASELGDMEQYNLSEFKEKVKE